MNAQNLSKHQWENRVLIILTDDINNKNFKTQIKALQNKTKGLEERKLIVYQIILSRYRTGISENQKWIERSNLYKDLKSNNKSFEVVLIGLDGGEKLRQSDELTIDKLFNVIDGMAMRRAEIGRNR